MPKAVAEEIAQALRARIGSGEFSASRRLPPERELAAEYGVARNTIRRALGLVSGAEGLTRAVGRGTYLETETAEPGAEEILSRVVGVSPADLMAVRRIVEPEAAALAAATASAAELAAIREAHRAAEAETGTEAFEGWDAEFHRRIFAASRNEMLMGLHDILKMVRTRAPWIELKRRTFSEARRAAYCADHAAVLEALEARDPGGAAEAMRSHMDAVARNLFGRSA